MRQDLSNEQKKGLDTAVMLVSWMVWKERNARVFNYTERTPNRLLSDIIAEGSNWIQAGAMKLSWNWLTSSVVVRGSVTSS